MLPTLYLLVQEKKDQSRSFTSEDTAPPSSAVKKERKKFVVCEYARLPVDKELTAYLSIGGCWLEALHARGAEKRR